MDLYIQLMLLGIGGGAIYAGLALGLVLAYQGSGVINFGHGAIAMYVAYVFDSLRKTGDFVYPMVGLPDSINLGDPMGTWTAFVVSMVVAAFLGLLIHLLVFYPLRAAPLLAKVVGSVGLMLFFQGMAFVQFGSDNVIVAPVLPQGQVNVPIIDVPIGKDRIYLAVIVALATLTLWVLYRFTRFGLATRAAAKEEKGAVLLGYSPSRLAAGNWVLSAVVAGALGVLASNITGLNTSNFILFIVPALACALLGRLESFVIAAAAGLALGMFESAITKMSTETWFPDWLPFSAAQKGLPFVVIIVFLFIGGKSLPTRGTLDTGRQARALMPTNVTATVAVLLPIAIAMLFVLPSSLRLALFFSLANAIIVLSVVILTGYVGQVSLAQAVFAGAAGFAMAKLAANSVPFPISTLLGALAATVVGVLMAIPALRIRGAQLAVVTMAAGVAVEEFVFKNKTFTGESGAQLVEPPSLFGIDLAANKAPPDFNRWQFGILLCIVLALLAVAVSNVRRGATGRRMLALRSNELAAAAAGIDVTRTKLLAFAVSSFVAGLGGAMLAYIRGAISSDSFSVFVSLVLLAFAYLGGIASVSGAIVGGLLMPGGLVFGMLDEWVFGETVSEYAVLIGGVALILTAILNPEGITGKVSEELRARRQSRTRGTWTEPPATGPGAPAGVDSSDKATV